MCAQKRQPGWKKDAASTQPFLQPENELCYMTLNGQSNGVKPMSGWSR